MRTAYAQDIPGTTDVVDRTFQNPDQRASFFFPHQRTQPILSKEILSHSGPTCGGNQMAVNIEKRDLNRHSGKKGNIIHH